MKTLDYTDHLASYDSSAIKQAWYDADTTRLYVEYPSGKIAGYTGVSKAKFIDFQNAQSKGRFYNADIKNKYIGVSGGDVWSVVFEKRKAPKTTVSMKKFKVAFRADGELEISAKDISEALSLFAEASKNFTSVEVTGVNQV